MTPEIISIIVDGAVIITLCICMTILFKKL